MKRGQVIQDRETTEIQGKKYIQQCMVSVKRRSA
jgi:hypothetical protein